MHSSPETDALQGAGAFAEAEYWKRPPHLVSPETPGPGNLHSWSWKTWSGPESSYRALSVPLLVVRYASQAKMGFQPGKREGRSQDELAGRREGSAMVDIRELILSCSRVGRGAAEGHSAKLFAAPQKGR